MRATTRLLRFVVDQPVWRKRKVRLPRQYQSATQGAVNYRRGPVVRKRGALIQEPGAPPYRCFSDATPKAMRKKEFAFPYTPSATPAPRNGATAFCRRGCGLPQSIESVIIPPSGALGVLQERGAASLPSRGLESMKPLAPHKWRGDERGQLSARASVGCCEAERS